MGEAFRPTLAPKIRQREHAREIKAEAAVERELLDRLRSGAYGEQPLNVDGEIWSKVLSCVEREGDGVADEDLDEGMEEYEMEKEDGIGVVRYVSDFEDSEKELVGGDMEDWLRSSDEEESDEEADGEYRSEGAGDKRKRGWVIHVRRKKGTGQQEVEREMEHELPVAPNLEF